jgi:hypothetical protein
VYLYGELGNVSWRATLDLLAFVRGVFALSSHSGFGERARS